VALTFQTQDGRLYEDRPAFGRDVRKAFRQVFESEKAERGRRRTASGSLLGEDQVNDPAASDVWSSAVTVSFLIAATGVEQSNGQNR
jgi:hypothetical protein